MILGNLPTKDSSPKILSTLKQHNAVQVGGTVLKLRFFSFCSRRSAFKQLTIVEYESSLHIVSPDSIYLLHPIVIVSQEKQNPNSTVSVWLLRNAFRKKKKKTAIHSRLPRGRVLLHQVNLRKTHGSVGHWKWFKGKIPRNLTGSTRKADGLDVSLL